MRISLLTRRFDPHGGGTERDLIVTRNAFATAGHEVTIFAERGTRRRGRCGCAQVGALEAGTRRAIAALRVERPQPRVARAPTWC